MTYVEAKIARKDDVIKAAKDGVPIDAIAQYSETEDGWRLDIQFVRDGQLHAFQGRLYRERSPKIAQEIAQRQLDQLLGKPRDTGKQYSNDYLAARDALEKKIQIVWDSAQETESDLIKPGPIKFNWKKKEPQLRVIRFTNVKKLEEKYQPEFGAYIEVSKAEAAALF